MAVSRLPFGVGYYVCLGHTGDANVTSPAVFWQRYDHSKFLNNFFLWIKSNHKMNRKQEEKRPDVVMIFLCLKYEGAIFSEVFYDLKWSSHIFNLKLVA